MESEQSEIRGHTHIALNCQELANTMLLYLASLMCVCVDAIGAGDRLGYIGGYYQGGMLSGL